MPGLERLEAGQLVRVAIEEIAQAVHDRDALGHRHTVPAAVLERGAGGRHGTVHVRLDAVRDPTDELARGRAADVQPSAARR